MDWTTNKGLTLLQEAYPDGYVPLRGVLTVGGWYCVETQDQDGVSGWNRADPDRDGLTDLGLLKDLPDARVNSGALLPLPDPADTATWACLLQEFVQAEDVRFPRTPLASPVTGHAWVQRWDPDARDNYWQAIAYSRLFRREGKPHYIDCDDPAEALIRARASLNQPPDQPK